MKLPRTTEATVNARARVLSPRSAADEFSILALYAPNGRPHSYVFRFCILILGKKLLGNFFKL